MEIAILVMAGLFVVGMALLLIARSISSSATNPDDYSFILPAALGLFFLLIDIVIGAGCVLYRLGFV